MILYFSGTGNSRFVAKFLTEKLQDEWVDMTPLMKAGKTESLSSDKPYVIVSPIYAWRMPAVLESFLKTISLHGSKMLYFIQTCGGDMGACGMYNQKLSEELGKEYFGTLEVVMPDNYILMFKAPATEESIDIIEKTLPSLQDAALKISQKTAFPDKRITLMDKIKSGIVNTGFNKYFVKADGFYVTEKCISCGACALSCPLNNITLSEGKPEWGSNCTRCMACICGCPLAAIEYGNKTKGKLRYRCPKSEI